MEITVIPYEQSYEVERVYAVSMVINAFKGRKDVEVHMFRPELDDSEKAAMAGYDWINVVEEHHHPDVEGDRETSSKVIYEAFTEAERDQVVEYLKVRYQDRVSSITACPLTLPLPIGVKPLSTIPEGKTIGFIRFDKIPNYTLPFAVHGLYDLAQHDPMVQDD